MSSLATNAITDASGGNTATINGQTPTESNMAGRNRIINGCMRIWQRGTSFSGSGYTADRWVATAGNVSRQSFPLGSNPTGLESPYYLNWSASSAANNEFLQRVEFVTTLQNQKATLSFWAKSSTGTETFGWAIYQNFGSGGSSLTAAGGGTYAPTTSWQKYTFTVDMPSLSGKTIGTNDFVWIRLAQLTTNNSVSLDITGVQLEAGSVATPFEHRQFGQELALCQRYYQLFEGFAGGSYTSTAIIGSVSFPVAMRAAPSVSATAAIAITYPGVADYTQSSPDASIVAGRASIRGIQVQMANFSGMANGRVHYQNVAVNNAALAFSAEL